MSLNNIDIHPEDYILLIRDGTTPEADIFSSFEE